MKKILASLTILSVLMFFTPNHAYAVATTWNSADKSADITLSGGDLTATQTNTGWHGVRGTTGKSSGLKYYEVTVTVVSEHLEGISNTTTSLDPAGNFASSGTGNVYYYARHGEKSNGDGTEPAYGNAYVTGNVVSIAVNFDTGKIWAAINGTWQNSGDPAAGTGEMFSGISGTYYPFFGGDNIGNISVANFGASAFAYTPPSGFSAWDATAAAPSNFGTITLFGDW